MKTLKKNAATWLLAMFCAVFMLPSIILTGCTNGIEGEPKFTASVIRDTLMVPNPDKDSIWRDTIIYIYVDKYVGIEKNGEPGIEKTDSTKYLTWYPIKDEGQAKDVSTSIKASVTFAKAKPIFITKDSLIGNPSFSTANRQTEKRIEGDFTKLEFRADLVWSWSNNYSITDQTIHEMAWYKGFLQMLSGFWGEECVVEYGKGKDYVHEGVEGRLFTHKIIRRAIYQGPYIKDDVRENVIEQPFFVPKNAGTNPDPIPGNKNITEVIQKNYDGDKTYVITRHYDDNTYSDTTVINTYGYDHSLEMPELGILYRDNTNFGDPTISNSGNPSSYDESKTRGNLIFIPTLQHVNAAYNAHGHILKSKYTALKYTEGGKSCDLTVPMWTINHNQTKTGTVMNKEKDGHTYEVTPISFIYDGKFGGENKIYNTDTEVWNDKGAVVTDQGRILKNFGLDYVNPTTSYAYANFYSKLSDNSEKELGKTGVEVYNTITVPAGFDKDADNFDVSDLKAVSTKQLIGSRKVPCEFGGEFVINKYQTLYSTRTNKAEVIFKITNEEVAYAPEKGSQITDDKWKISWEIQDLGSTANNMVELGRRNGKDGKSYETQITASFNGHSTGVLKSEVRLWVATPNKYGIASGSQGHTWDYSNAHHVATVFVYNTYENGVLVSGGLKGYIDGAEVTKATWDEVNQPSGVMSLAQTAGGQWVFCNVAKSGTDYTWRSIMKANNGTAITSITEKTLATIGAKEVFINSSSQENEDGSVTVSSTSGVATASAW